MRGPVDLDRDHDAVPLRRGSGTAGRRRARLPTGGGLAPWPGIPRMPPELMPNGRRFLTWLEAWPTVAWRHGSRRNRDERPKWPGVVVGTRVPVKATPRATLPTLS